jgi:hypothetical protein
VVTLASLMTASAFAQPPGGGRGGFGMGQSSPLQLVGNAAVQKELGMSEDQIAKAKTLGDEAREELTAGGGGGFQGLRDLPEDERRAKMEEMRAKMAETAKKVNDKYKPKLAAVLDAKQMTRLQQIHVQAAGPGAYSDPDVATALGLSKDQQDKIASIQKAFGDKQREMFAAGGGGGGGGADREERMAKVRELNDTHNKDLAAVLTADQQTKFASLKGAEFDVSQLRRAPAGGGGAGGRPGGGRPGAEGRPQRQPQTQN